MRPSSKLLSLLLALVFPMGLWAQAKQGERLVTIRVDNIRIRDLLSIIVDQTQLNPLYNSDQLDDKEKVSVNFENEPLDNVLAFLLRKRGLTWKYHDDTYIVKFKKPGDPDLGRLPEEKQTAVTVLVTGEDDHPIPYASVIVKPSGKMGQTDDNGVVRLLQVQRNAELMVSSIGYSTAYVPINGNSVLKINLQPSMSNLDEVMVIAYGTSSRRNLTGAISRVTAAEIAQQPTGNPILAMQGRVPGLYINQLSGLPGGEIKVELRGRNSIAAGNNPLYIVDGIPFPATALTLNNVLPEGAAISPLKASNPLNMLNASNIESIEILKDADATSIYGSRGANGVILITTKKGQAGKTSLDVDVYSGIGTTSRQMQFLNSAQYLEMRREAMQNDKIDPQNADPDLAWGNSRYTNWEKVMLGGTASISDAQLAIHGGSSMFRYRVAGGYRKETTVYPGSFRFDKASLQTNLIFTPNDRTETILKIGYTNDRSYLPTTDLAAYTRTAPNAPESYINGNLNWENGSYDNPMGALLRPYKAYTEFLTMNLVSRYRIWKGLRFETSMGFSKIFVDEKQPTPFYSLNPASGNNIDGGGYTTFGNNYFRNWIIEPQLRYEGPFAKGKLAILAGLTFQEDIRDQKGFLATKFAGGAAEQLENMLAASQIEALGYKYYQYRYNAFFGRINYNYQGKYIFHGTVRNDGSSRFAPNSEFATFFSAGTAWIFSEENWVKMALPSLSFGKLRASYGTSGNDQIKDYAYMATRSPGNMYDGQRGLVPERLSNNRYRWEKSRKFETALELGFLRDKILLRTAYYYNLSTSQLVNYPLPLITGANSVLNNVPARVKNTGWEFELNSTIVKKEKITWNTFFNLTVPWNKLVSFPNIETSSYNSRLSVGDPLDIVKAYEYMGIDPESGLYTLVDINKGLNSLKPTGPTLYGGLQNNLEFNNWRLDLLFQFVAQQRYNYLLADQPPGTPFVNQPLAVMDRWRSPGGKAAFQRFTQSLGEAYEHFILAQQSDASITDASFIRLKSVNLSYNLPKRWIEKARLHSARLFLQGQNLLTITSYKGRDPEVAADRDVYPPLRVYTAGIQITL